MVCRLHSVKSDSFSRVFVPSPTLVRQLQREADRLRRPDTDVAGPADADRLVRFAE